MNIKDMLPKGNRLTDSMLVWFPKIKDLGIPQPKTEIVMLTNDEICSLYEGCNKSIIDKVDKTIKENFNLPIFIRTDQSSGKHYWKDTCFYDGKKELAFHLFSIAEFNFCCDLLGLPFKSFVLREYIPMASQYTAFEEMPVNPERRYFIKDGKILCHHAYWIKDAIRNASVENWEQLSDEMNIETKEEIDLLSNYALDVSKAIEGFWSVDFCKAKDGTWYLIDMATGENSFHPKH